MTERSPITFLRDRLSALALVTYSQAGRMIQDAMAAGEIEAVAGGVSVRADAVEATTDILLEDHALKPNDWQRCRVDWDARHLHFIFYVERAVYTASDLTVSTPAAIAFLQARDPLRSLSATSAEPPPARTSRRKGPGGRGGDFEWEKCLIEAARWMHIEGVPSKQADLIRHMEEWFGEDAPGDTQLKEHLGPLYLALKTGKPPD